MNNFRISKIKVFTSLRDPSINSTQEVCKLTNKMILVNKTQTGRDSPLKLKPVVQVHLPQITLELTKKSKISKKARRQKKVKGSLLHQVRVVTTWRRMWRRT